MIFEPMDESKTGYFPIDTRWGLAQVVVRLNFRVDLSNDNEQSIGRECGVLRALAIRC